MDKNHVVFIVMDSCRYDSFMSASTPARQAREGLTAAEIAGVERAEGNAQGVRILTRLPLPAHKGG